MIGKPVTDPQFLQTGPSHLRATAREIPKTKFGPARPMRDLPRKFSDTLEQNQKLNLCCRHMENVTGQYYKIDQTQENPDLFIATCGECGRNHYRFAAGAS